MIKQRWFLQLIVATVIGSLVWSCSTVPLTGRKRINLMPESEMISMSFTQYDEFLSENPLSTNAAQTAMVKKVGKNIAAAVEAYFAQNGWSDQLKGFDWEFNLVADATPNAWCMPGGKVVFYEGILPVTQDEAGLAVVMGHEIAHAVARHGSERMTQQMAAQMGSTALDVVFAEKPEQTQTIYQTAFGVATQVGVILPFSRKHEYEADRMGLIFMSMAGYDPSVAVDFWTRMSALSDGGSSMTFMSTHPSNEARIRELKNALPEAMSYFKE